MAPTQRLVAMSMVALLACTIGATVVGQHGGYDSRGRSPFGTDGASPAAVSVPGATAPSDGASPRQWPDRGQTRGGGMPSTPMSSASRQYRQPLMVRVDLNIADQIGTATPTRKTVSLIVADGERGIIRAENHSKTGGERGSTGPSLNVEARPLLVEHDKIRLDLSVLYDLPDVPSEPGAQNNDSPWTTRLQESFGLILDNGKTLLVAQSADPRTTRKVSVEVTATIQRGPA